MNSILTMDAEEGKVSFIIPHIVYVNKKDRYIELVLNCSEPRAFYTICLPDKLEADGAYLRIMSIIESYYDAMMPPKDNNVDAAKEIILLQDEAKRAHEKAYMLANFISVLYCHTMGDREIAPSHLEGKMKRLEQWVADKAKEGK